MPHAVRDGIGGYNNITDEVFIFGGWNTQYLHIGYKYSYKTGIRSGIILAESIRSSYSQYYTQYNNVIYYYSGLVTHKINTYNMTYPYSQRLFIDLGAVLVYDSPCLSVDSNGNLFLSSSGFALFGNHLNYYGYNIRSHIWETFRHSSYWYQYNYDMRRMACIVYNQVLYTFGGFGGANENLSEYYGSNMISYHDISDYSAPFLLNGYSLWNKVSQNLTQPGGYMRAVIVGELIYIIGGFSNNANADGTCCVRGFNDVQIFDPNTHTIIGKSDGVIPLPTTAWWSTTCHYRSTMHTINCFGGRTHSGVSNEWIYSNPLMTNSPSITPSHLPSISPSNVPSDAPSYAPSNAPSKTPSKAPSDAPSYTPSNAPSKTPSKAPSKIPSNAPSYAPSNAPSYAPSYAPSKSPSDAPSNLPSKTPSKLPSNSPSNVPSDAPSKTPSKRPSNAPSNAPSYAPSGAPSKSPSDAPSKTPSKTSSNTPSYSPSDAPSKSPSNAPYYRPSDAPSKSTLNEPSKSPIYLPTNSTVKSETNNPTLSLSTPIPTYTPTISVVHNTSFTTNSAFNISTPTFPASQSPNQGSIMNQIKDALSTKMGLILVPAVTGAIIIIIIAICCYKSKLQQNANDDEDEDRNQNANEALIEIGNAFANRDGNADRGGIVDTDEDEDRIDNATG